QNAMQAWSLELSKDRNPATPVFAKQMADLGQALTDCLTAANAVEPGETKAPAQPIFDADQIIKLAFEQRGPYVVADVALAYIDVRAQVDRTYGQIDVVYGRLKPPDPADHPQRPTGAPVEEQPLDPLVTANTCPRYVWKAGKRE